MKGPIQLEFDFSDKLLSLFDFLSNNECNISAYVYNNIYNDIYNSYYIYTTSNSANLSSDTNKMVYYV